MCTFYRLYCINHWGIYYSHPNPTLFRTDYSTHWPQIVLDSLIRIRIHWCGIQFGSWFHWWANLQYRPFSPAEHTENIVLVLNHVVEITIFFKLAAGKCWFHQTTMGTRTNLRLATLMKEIPSGKQLCSFRNFRSHAIYVFVTRDHASFIKSKTVWIASKGRSSKIHR